MEEAEEVLKNQGIHMKKHAGKFVCAGLLVSVFGLILMVGVLIVTNLILGARYSSAPEFIRGTVTVVGDASWIFLGLGMLVLAMGLYMHTGKE